MQGTYIYLPVVNHVVVTVYGISVLFPLLNVLYFYISTFCSVWAVLSVCFFCSSSALCSPVMLLRCCVNDLDTVPVAPIIIYYCY